MAGGISVQDTSHKIIVAIVIHADTVIVVNVVVVIVVIVLIHASSLAATALEEILVC